MNLSVRPELFQSVLLQYSLDTDWTVEEGESGMNNVTRKVTAADGNKAYMLRIYNNHRDASIVLLEHEILTALNESPLELRVPSPLPNRNGSTVTEAADGRIASLCEYIPGARPCIDNSAQVLSLGKAAARLAQAFAGLHISRKPIYEPYFMLQNTYRSLGDDAFAAIAEASGKLAANKAYLELLQREFNGSGRVCEAARQLPRQWIHGDLVMNNSVAAGDEMAGLLDFEFSTIDARAMEVAVSLMDIIQASPESSRLNRVSLFCEGFRSQMVLLTEGETEWLPELMKLRLLDVSLHFINRYKEGLDDVQVLEGIICGAGEAIAFVHAHEAELKRIMRG